LSIDSILVGWRTEGPSFTVAGCASGPEILAVGAVGDVELVADHWPEHRMGAVQQLAIHDGV
jgi:hypothetical protein